jgi:hypothetical protein
MTHVTEDELVLHYYGEMPADEEQRASAHLSSCGGCHAQYRRLQRVLAAIDEAAVAAPDLPPHLERTIWARLEPNLRRDANGWLKWLAISPARLAWAAAIVVLVAASFYAGRLSPTRDAATERAAATSVDLRERVLLMDLGEHLDRSQMVLVEILTAEGEEAFTVSSERERAEQLLAANRLYRETAASTGDASILTFLDELERVLVDVAAGPEELPADRLAEVRRRIDSQGLLFKVRVLSSEVRERQRTNVRQRAEQRSSL